MWHIKICIKVVFIWFVFYVVELQSLELEFFS